MSLLEKAEEFWASKSPEQKIALITTAPPAVHPWETFGSDWMAVRPLVFGAGGDGGWGDVMAAEVIRVANRGRKWEGFVQGESIGRFPLRNDALNECDKVLEKLGYILLRPSRVG